MKIAQSDACPLTFTWRMMKLKKKVKGQEVEVIEPVLLWHPCFKDRCHMWDKKLNECKLVTAGINIRNIGQRGENIGGE